jgi:hypothetical protein
VETKVPALVLEATRTAQILHLQTIRLQDKAAAAVTQIEADNFLYYV